MKAFLKAFCIRGLMAATGGPIILAIIYGTLGSCSVIESLSPIEVCTSILSITAMAFIAAGITAIYTVEQLPLISAILLHGGVLYLDYLLVYLLNSWIPRNSAGIATFSTIFVAGYAIIWAGIYLWTKRKTDHINQKLQQR